MKKTGSVKSRSAAADGRKPNSVQLRSRFRPSGAVTIIPLAPPSLAGSSSLPGSFGRAVLKRFPIWPCSVRGFACHPCYHGRGALLPHLFTLTPTYPVHLKGVGRAYLTARHHSRSGEPDTPGRYIFCATFLRVAPTGRYPAHCPAEFGLSSRLRSLREQRRTII